VDGGWADTWVVRPGNSTLSLMVQYTLPYEDGASVSHLLKYPTTTINLPLPDVGVSLDLDDGWVPGQQAAMGGGSFTSYTMSNLAAGSELTMAFEGRPRLVAGATTVERDNTTELLVGGLVAVAVIGIAVVLISRWRREPEEELDRDELLELIAGLDDAYEMGEIAEDEYLAEREGLLAELKTIWEQEG